MGSSGWSGVGGGEGTAGPRHWEAQRPLPWENGEHAAGDLGYRLQGTAGVTSARAAPGEWLA